MNHKLYLVVLFVFNLFTSKVLSQDLIVTNDNDSLNVEIIKIDEGQIYFVSYEPKKTRNVLPKSDIKSFRYIYYSEKRKNKHYFDPNDTKFRIGLVGGVSVVLSGADDDASDFFKQYVRNVNAGWHGKLEVDYYFDNNFGVGLVADRYMTSGFEPNVIFTNTVTDSVEIGELSDKVRMNYFGALLSYNINTKKSNYSAFIAGGPGIIFYRDDLVRVDPYVATGTAFGTHFSAGLDFVVSDNVTMTFELSGTFGKLQQYDLKSEDQIVVIEEEEDISRINISIGIRYFR